MSTKTKTAGSRRKQGGAASTQAARTGMKVAGGAGKRMSKKGTASSRAKQDDDFFNHPEVIASIRRGEEDIKAGRMSVYDPATGETKPYKPS